MSARGELSERTRAVIEEAAARNAGSAPPLRPWQIAILAPLFAPAGCEKDQVRRSSKAPDLVGTDA